MDIRNLKSTAAERISAASYSPRRLALIHTGAAVILSLLLTIINYLLAGGMENTGGLAGIGTRSLLATAQTVLLMAGSVALPFWDFGFYRASLNITRQESATPATLLTGFRRFGPTLRLLLLRALMTVGVSLACVEAATTIFMLTPLSNGFWEQAETIIKAGTEVTPEVVQSLMPFLTPVYILSGILACVILIPLLYRFRLADYAIMDDDATGALAAMKKSNHLLRGKKLAMFKLDLSFWWYYGLLLLAMAVSYGDTLLPLLGLPTSDMTTLLFAAISGAFQLLIAWRFAAYVHTTTATAYNELTIEN